MSKTQKQTQEECNKNTGDTTGMFKYTQSNFFVYCKLIEFEHR